LACYLDSVLYDSSCSGIFFWIQSDSDQRFLSHDSARDISYYDNFYVSACRYVIASLPICSVW